MTPDIYLRTAVEPALSILPARFDSREAHALLLTIALQETDLQARRQIPGGEALSHQQIQLDGLIGILKHPASAPAAAAFIHELDYSDLTPPELWRALEFDGVLAAGMARLNLYPDPAPLPRASEPHQGLSYYLRVWRPGIKRPEKWLGNWSRAWAAFD